MKQITITTCLLCMMSLSGSLGHAEEVEIQIDGRSFKITKDHLEHVSGGYSISDRYDLVYAPYAMGSKVTFSRQIDLDTASGLELAALLAEHICFCDRVTMRLNGRYSKEDTGNGILSDPQYAQDRHFWGTFTVAVVGAGKLKLEECRDELMKHLTFTILDEGFPVGIFSSPMYYPVANALAEIGGKETVKAVLQKLSGRRDGPPTQEEVYLLSWILQQILGDDIAPLAVQNWIKRDGTNAELELSLKLVSIPRLILEGCRKKEIIEGIPIILKKHEENRGTGN